MEKYVIKLTRGIKISELEMFEFEKRYNTKTGNITHYVNKAWNMSIDVKKRIIEPKVINERISPFGLNVSRRLNPVKFFTNKDVCNLYDLIKAGLVEKVSE